MVEKSKLSLENCRQYMTKEWLKSLLLKGPSKLFKEVEGNLRNAPEDCLKLVLKVCECVCKCMCVTYRHSIRERQ